MSNKLQEANIMIGTPAYNHQIHTDYLHSIMGFVQAEINFSLMTIGNESLITRARNSVVAKFDEHKGFTHLLFLDADIFLEANDLLKLIVYEKDSVGAPVPLKSMDAEGKKRYNVGKVLDDSTQPAKVSRVGTAALLLSRKAVDALIEDARARKGVYSSNIGMPDGSPNSEHFDIFQVGVVDGEYLSEDFWVCQRLKSLGFDTYVDLTMKVRHHGMYQF